MSSANSQHGPQLTVVCSTMASWPKLRRGLLSVADQIKSTGSAIIIAGGQSDSIPAEAVEQIFGDYPFVTLYCEPGAHIFRLRCQGVRRVTTPYFVLMEDHNELVEGHLQQALQIFESNQEIDALTPAALNGTNTTVLDRASFLQTFGIYSDRPYLEGTRRIPNIAGSGYRASAVPLADLKEGQLELLIAPHLYHEGRTLFAPSVQMIHHQNFDLLRTANDHFFNAKACFGYLRTHLGFGGILRWLLIAAVLPFGSIARWLFSSRQHLLAEDKNYLSLPFLFFINVLYSLGIVSGFVAGVGKSPYRLE